MFLAALLLAAADPAALSSPLSDYNLGYDAAGATLVFARSEAEFRNARIFIAERRGTSWAEPRPIAFSDARYADSDPWLTPDGRTLYFISTRPAEGREEGRTDYDIWRSRRTASGWSAPERLGDEVNSRGQELGPELHGDTLYFSSARRSGRGGLDIYSARASGAGFEPAALLEAPFNTAASESDFTLSADGTQALFWRMVGERGLIHHARRTASGWSTPVPLPDSINRGAFNFTPHFTRDARGLTYASNVERQGQAAGLADLFEAALPAE
jgi:hypothetical protein